MSVRFDLNYSALKVSPDCKSMVPQLLMMARLLKRRSNLDIIHFLRKKWGEREREREKERVYERDRTRGRDQE